MPSVCKPTRVHVPKTRTNGHHGVNMVSNCPAFGTFIKLFITPVSLMHKLFILLNFQHDLRDFAHVLQVDIIWRTLITLILILILEVYHHIITFSFCFPHCIFFLVLTLHFSFWFPHCVFLSLFPLCIFFLVRTKMNFLVDC